MVGGHGAARHAVHQHRDPQRLGQPQQRRLGVPPPHVGAGHDHRALRAGQQTRGGIERVAVGRGPGRAARPARRARRRRAPRRTRDPSGSRRTPPPTARRPRPAARRRSAPPTASADCAVAANRVSGATNGTWSISCSDPCPQRSAGARPPSTTSGDWFCCAAAIALIPLVTPGPGGERGDARHPGHLRPALGGERRGLLVAGVDQPDVLGATTVVDGEQVPTGQGEDRVDTAGPQPAGDQMSRVDA